MRWQPWQATIILAICILSKNKYPQCKRHHWFNNDLRQSICIHGVTDSDSHVSSTFAFLLLLSGVSSFPCSGTVLLSIPIVAIIVLSYSHATLKN